jgi:hypothetical protein
MSQQPPPPPKTPLQKPSPDDYVEIEVPLDDDTSEQRTVVQIQGGQSGCLWGCGGGLGCLVILLAVLFLGIVVAGQSLGGFVGQFGNFFNVDVSFLNLDERATVNVPRNIYIPPVERIQALSELTTTRFNYSQIVTGQTDMPALLAGLYGESLVMVAVGHVEAGIDLSHLTEADVSFDEESATLTIHVPAPVLQDCFLDEGESYIAQRQSGVFAQPSPALDTATRRYAITQFRETALEDGILQEAASRTKDVLFDFLSITTEARLNLVMDEVSTDTSLPDTCG